MKKLFVTLSLLSIVCAAACTNVTETGDKPPTCQGYPTCLPGDWTVQSQGHCLPAPNACYQQELCGNRIWCTGPRATE